MGKPQRQREVRASTGRSSSHQKAKKPVSELDMTEGPEAFSRLRSVMKSILSGRGTSSRDPDARTSFLVNRLWTG